MSELHIGKHRLAADAPPYLIAEIAQAHDGSLGTAHAYIDVAAAVGVEAVKFQVHVPEAESTLDEMFRVKFSYEDDTRYGYWQRTSFTPDQWAGLAEHAKQRNLDFIVSVFSDAAFDFMSRIGVSAWKMASGEVFAGNRIARMAATGLPLLISTGMSAWDDIDAACAEACAHDAGFAVMQCTSRYPTPVEEVGLNVIDQLAARYEVPVGLSDHSGSIWPPVAAMARGAHLLEMHIVFDRRAFGPDAVASLTPDEFARVVEARDAIHAMAGHPVDKDAMAQELRALRALFSQSVAPAEALPKGAVLEHCHLTMKKPGTGIPPERLDGLVGRRLARDVSPDRLLREDDIE